MGERLEGSDLREIRALAEIGGKFVSLLGDWGNAIERSDLSKIGVLAEIGGKSVSLLEDWGRNLRVVI
ncbi:MAG: hypothetical protein AAGF87_09185 [Bacteroidota bacterium]